MDEVKLTEAVMNFPCICEVYSKSYKDLRSKENAWKQIAIEGRQDKYILHAQSYICKLGEWKTND